MIKLSIIIVNLNGKKLTLDCIKSIKEANPPFFYEIIVVDNGSNDGSVEELKKLQGPSFHTVFNKTNLGYAKANNQGIKKAIGEYLLLLNNDTIVKKGSLESLLNFAEKNTDCGVVGPKLLNKDGSLQPSCFHFPSIKNAILEYWFGRKGLFEKYAPEGKAPSQVDAVVGAVFLITPQAREKVGILDERYFAYFEDIDYCRRVWKAGLRVYYLPEVEIIHYHGATFKKMEKEELRWRKLIPGSKIYHGVLKHYILTSVLWLGQKWQKLLGKNP